MTWAPNVPTEEEIEGFVEDLMAVTPEILGIDETIPGCEVINMDPYGVGVGTLPRYLKVAIREYYQDVLYRGGLTGLAVGDFVTVTHFREGNRYEVTGAGGGSGTVPSLPDYAQGSIIRGGAADWEAYDAKTDKQILVGDGVDIASVPVTQDVALANTGAATVEGIQGRTVGAGAPVDGQIYVWDAGAGEWLPVSQPATGNATFKVDGALIVTTHVDCAYIVTGELKITAVYIHCGTLGTAGSTIVDTNKNGVTIFTVQANRPALAWNDADSVAKSGVPNVVDLVELDILTVDIDQIATGAKDLSVTIALKGEGSVTMIDIQEDDVLVTAVDTLNFEGESNRVTDEGGNKATVALGMWELIEEQVLVGSVASVTFAAIPGTYRSLVLQCQARTDQAAEADAVNVRFNGDAGANYDWVQFYGRGDGNHAASCTRAGTGMQLVHIDAANSRASNFTSGTVTILGYALADREKWAECANSGAFGDVSADGDVYVISKRGRWRNTAAITSITLLPVVGANLVAGSRFTLYGIL